MCLYPTLIKNRKYTANAKNGGNVPPIKDKRTEYVPIGCGDCIECRNMKAREWQVRLLEDIKDNKNGKFITLTFSNEKYTEIVENTKALKELEHIKQLEGYQRDNAIATAAVRLFMERHRKRFKKPLRHWLITELGHEGTNNIHLHGIIWTDEKLETIEKLWSYGWMWKGKKSHKGRTENYVNSRTVNYIVKYVTKKDTMHDSYKSIILTSPGIGRNYTEGTDARKNKYNGEQTNETYRTSTGHKMSIPIYWRNKIYSEEQREQLWLQKLDKEERWICGEKVDISKSEKEYYKLLEVHRARNRELGYGNGEKTYNQLEYEKERRNIANETRIAKAKKEWKKLLSIGQ